MASRTLVKAVRSPLAKQLAPAVQRRTFAAIAAAARPTVAKAVAAAPGRQQTRGVKTVDFAGVKEDVYGMSCNDQIHRISLTCYRARRLAS